MIEIKTLPPDEWQKYKKIRLESLKESPLAFGKTYEEDAALSDDDWMAKLKKVQEDGGTWLLFAMKGDKIIGMLGAYRDSLQKFQHIVHIIGVYVTPKERGSGVGKQLFQELLKNITKDSTVKKMKLIVAVGQDAAKAMYLSEGFKAVGRQEKEICFEGDYYDEILMEKIL